MSETNCAVNETCGERGDASSETSTAELKKMKETAAMAKMNHAAGDMKTRRTTEATRGHTDTTRFSGTFRFEQYTLKLEQLKLQSRINFAISHGGPRHIMHVPL